MNTVILANDADVAGPLHAILINFTAGLLPVAVIFDLLGMLLKKDALHTAAWWTLLAAAIVTPLTAAAGWWWFLAQPDEHQGLWQMPIHQWLGTALAIVLVPAAVWRGRIARRGTRPGWVWGATAVGLLGAVTIQGELGGSMYFGRGLILHGTVEAPASSGAGAGHQHETGGH